MSRAFIISILMLVVASSSWAEEIRVTLLGTGSPGPYMNRFGPATLIQAGDQTLLVDSGRGVMLRLWERGIPVRDINAVFLTHFHHDHFNGLADLWLTGWLRTGYGQRTEPMVLIGPDGTQTIADGLQLAYSRNREIRVADELLPAAAASFAVREFVAPALAYEEEGVQVTTFPVNHGELITPAVGYRVDYAGLSVLISGDTTYDERLIEAAAGVDLLVHEVMAWDEEAMSTVPGAAQIAAHHTTPEEAGQIFAQAAPKMAAYTHLVLRGVTDAEIEERTRITYQGPLAIGQDQMSFIVSEQGVTVVRP